MTNVIDGRRYEPGWFERAFASTRPVVLELGCGRGEYTLALARSRPDRAVIGVDRNGARLWKGADRAREEGLANAVFLRDVVEHLEDHIPPRRVDAIWIPFPDPLPKLRQVRRRLVGPSFLESYRRLLVSGGRIHLKTDNFSVVSFAERSVREVRGQVVAGVDPSLDGDDELTAIKTTYEKRYLDAGRSIFARTFSFP